MQHHSNLEARSVVSANAGFCDVGDSAALGTIRYHGPYDLSCVIYWIEHFGSDDPGPMSYLNIRSGFVLKS